MTSTNKGKWEAHPRDKIPRQVDMDKINHPKLGAYQSCNQWLDNFQQASGTNKKHNELDPSGFHFQVFAFESIISCDFNTKVLNWPTLESFTLTAVPVDPKRVAVFIQIKNLPEKMVVKFGADVKVRTSMGTAIYQMSYHDQTNSVCVLSFKSMDKAK